MPRCRGRSRRRHTHFRPASNTSPELEKPVRGAIHLGKRTLRVIGKRDDDADQPPVLVVEDDD